jgi:hypothetical protein
MTESAVPTKVFLGWSKTRSKEMGLALRTWLKMVIQAVDPWISEHDLEGGTRWNLELAAQLEECNFGIVCLTPENRESVWIHFEAGAIAKVVDQSRLVPYLLDLEEKHVTGPLTDFQMLRADEDGTFKLMRALNGSLKGRQLDKEVLAETFKLMWPKLGAEIDRIRKMPGGSAPARRPEDMIPEILADVRTLRRMLEPSELNQMIRRQLMQRMRSEELRNVHPATPEERRRVIAALRAMQNDPNPLLHYMADRSSDELVDPDSDSASPPVDE